MMRRIQILIGSLFLILATVGALGGLAWYKYQSILAASAMPPPPELPISVMLAPVEMRGFQQSSTMIGTILAPRSITLSNEVPGTVIELSFQPGSVVEADQVLVRLDSSVEDAQLEAAKARLTLAESTLKRLRSTVDAISQLELEEAIGRRDEALAVEAELTARIRRHTIRAPFRARAGLSDTHLGQYLPPGTPITTLQSLDGFLLVDFMLPQHVADVIHVGDSVRLGVAEQGITAQIVAFDAIADRGTRNLKARAQIDDPPEFMQPGDSVRVIVDYGPILETTVVPVQALRRSPDGTLVYIAEVDASGQTRARAQPVQAGPAEGNLVRVFAGLNATDQVIADGSFKLRDGNLIANAASPVPPPSNDPTVP